MHSMYVEACDVVPELLDAGRAGVGGSALPVLGAFFLITGGSVSVILAQYTHSQQTEACTEPLLGLRG